MGKTIKTKQEPVAASMQVNDPARIAKIRAVFSARGMGELSLSMMARLMIDEWLASHAASAPKASEAV